MVRAIVLGLLPLALIAQVSASPAFEVASVKPRLNGRTIDGWSHSSVDIPSPGRLVGENSSLDELIRYAYQVREYQILGPNWLNDDSECFDIAAKATPETPQRQMRAMLQTLLVDRFKLALHHETRTLSVFKLVTAKNGPELHVASEDGERPGTSSAGGNLKATHLSMSGFAYWLSRDLHRPVFDETGKKGRFDFSLQYDPGTSDQGRPSLATALQEQLGLRLEGGKGPVEMLIIDHLEKRPTEN